MRTCHTDKLIVIEMLSGDVPLRVRKKTSITEAHFLPVVEKPMSYLVPSLVYSIQIEQFHHRSDERIWRRTAASDGTVRRVWSIPGCRSSRCYGQPAVQRNQPTASQIRHRAVPHD